MLGDVGCWAVGSRTHVRTACALCVLLLQHSVLRTTGAATLCAVPMVLRTKYVLGAPVVLPYSTTNVRRSMWNVDARYEHMN